MHLHAHAHVPVEVGLLLHCHCFTRHQDRDNQFTPGFMRSLEAMGCEIRFLVVKKTVATMVNKDVMHMEADDQSQ